MRFIFLMLTATLLVVACKRKGCTDVYALNYDEKAVKDDFSCEYPTQVKITKVTYEYPATDTQGNPWDPSDDPDTQVSFSVYDSYSLSTASSYSGPYVTNNSSGIAEFDSGTAKIDSLNQMIYIKLYDGDPLGVFTQMITMHTTSINLWDYTLDGVEENMYPSTLTFDHGGGFVCTINLEWSK